MSVSNEIKIWKGLNRELNIFSKEVDFMDELIKIYEIFLLNGKIEKDDITEIFSISKNNNLML